MLKNIVQIRKFVAINLLKINNYMLLYYFNIKKKKNNRNYRKSFSTIKVKCNKSILTRYNIFFFSPHNNWKFYQIRSNQITNYPIVPYNVKL